MEVIGLINNPSMSDWLVSTCPTVMTKKIWQVKESVKHELPERACVWVCLHTCLSVSLPLSSRAGDKDTQKSECSKPFARILIMRQVATLYQLVSL